MVLPILLIVLFGVIDFGMGLRSYVSLSNATREGARYAVVGNAAGAYPSNCTGSNTTTVIGRVCVAINGLKLSDVQSVTVTYTNGQTPGSIVTVHAHYHYKFITPIGAIVNFFSAGSLPAYVDLTTSADMRVE